MATSTIKSEYLEDDFWETQSLSNSSEFPVDISHSVKLEKVSSQSILSGDPLQSVFFNAISKKCTDGIHEKNAKSKMETSEAIDLRRKANAERQAKKRLLETPEQREVRRVKDVLRARQRRKKETDEETKIRRMHDAARAQVRRQNETDEERTIRQIKDLERVTKRRRNETEEKRMERLRKNREYSARRRYIQRWEQEFNHSKKIGGVKNFEQDVTALSSFRSELSNKDYLEVQNGVPDISLAFNHFLSNFSQDTDNSEELMRSFPNDPHAMNS